MNFLAHAYLAGDDAGLIVGGVFGDWIKGPLAKQALPPDLARGVALHRAIDTYADGNAAFLSSRARVAPARRRWSGVFVDLYYDHLLAANWSRHHGQPLDDHLRRLYALLAARSAELPENVRPVARLIADENWFGHYATVDGLREIFERMSRRVRQPNPLADAVDDLLRDGAGFAADFAEFLPAAQGFVAEWLSRAPPNAGSG